MSEILQKSNAGVIVRVFVQPRASKNEIIGLHNGAIKIKLASPPVDGQANAGLCEFLAKIFALPKRDVILLKGETSRQKVLELQGITMARAQEIFGL